MKSRILILFLLPIGLKAQELKPTEDSVLVNVIVTNFKDVPSAGEIVHFYDVTQKKTYTRQSDNQGKFSMRLPKGRTFKISVQSFADDVVYSEFDTDSDAGLITIDLQIQFEEKRTVYTLEDLNFDVDKATIRKESFPQLNELVNFLTAKKSMRIEVAGHTDSDGDDEHNLKLSQERAEAVKAYLVSKGISADRIVAKGYGETQPISSEETPEGKQTNRRTEVRIQK